MQDNVVLRRFIYELILHSGLVSSANFRNVGHAANMRRGEIVIHRNIHMVYLNVLPRIAMLLTFEGNSWHRRNIFEIK